MSSMPTGHEQGSVEEELREAARGRSERTPLVVLIGVALAVGGLVALVTLVATLAILLTG